jgi:DNA polymerase-4
LSDAAEADPPDLFDPQADKRKRVEQAMDAVRAKLGKDAIAKGRGR